ncbi:MAG: GNAT family N-acetyltransferase [bacterium]
MADEVPGIDAKHPPSAIVDPEGPLMLRAPRITDALAVYEAKIESLAALRQFMAWAHGPQSVEQDYQRMSGAVGAFWRGDDFVFMMCDPADEARVLGCIGLHRRAMNPRAIEVGYWVRTGASGSGICTRAARMLVVVAVEHMGFVRVQCGYDVGNAASERVIEKVGFRAEGDLRGYYATGDDAMRADGWISRGINRMCALDPSEARAQPWYAATRDRLVVHDWLGRVAAPMASVTPAR